MPMAMNKLHTFESDAFIKSTIAPASDKEVTLRVFIDRTLVEAAYNHVQHHFCIEWTPVLR
jgi:hypothetical protein